MNQVVTKGDTRGWNRPRIRTPLACGSFPCHGMMETGLDERALRMSNLGNLMQQSHDWRAAHRLVQRERMSL